jgi:hypothetical protein
LAPGAEDVSPYPGAKPYLLIDAERWEDHDWMSDLVHATAAELPAPKPKPAQASKKTGQPTLDDVPNEWGWPLGVTYCGKHLVGVHQPQWIERVL